MARAYCTVADVKKYLPQNIITEGQNPDPNPFNPSPETLPVVNIEFFIEQACIQIDSNKPPKHSNLFQLSHPPRKTSP